MGNPFAVFAVLLIIFWPLMITPYHLILGLVLQVCWLALPVVILKVRAADAKRSRDEDAVPVDKD